MPHIPKRFLTPFVPTPAPVKRADKKSVDVLLPDFPEAPSPEPIVFDKADVRQPIVRQLLGSIDIRSTSSLR